MTSVDIARCLQEANESGEDTLVMERRQESRQRQHAQEMEVIDQFTSAMAHDLNNRLTTILSYAELAQDAFAPEDRGYRDVEEVTKAATSAAILVRQRLMKPHDPRESACGGPTCV